MLSLPSNCALARAELPVEELLWNTVIWHVGDVACPSQLGLAHDSGGTEKVCLLQDFCVRDFVLPVNVENVSGAPQMKVVDQLLMPSVHSPGFPAID